MMRECIRLDMQCANTCRLTAQFMTLNSESVQQLCQFCADISSARRRASSINTSTASNALRPVSAVQKSAVKWRHDASRIEIRCGESQSLTLSETSASQGCTRISGHFFTLHACE